MRLLDWLKHTFGTRMWQRGPHRAKPPCRERLNFRCRHLHQKETDAYMINTFCGKGREGLYTYDPYTHQYFGNNSFCRGCTEYEEK